jgi:hypothetical protein
MEHSMDTSADYNLEQLRGLLFNYERLKKVVVDVFNHDGSSDGAYNVSLRIIKQIEVWPRLRGHCRRIGIACETDSKTVEALQDWLHTFQGLALEQARELPLLEAPVFVESAPERLQEPGQRNSVMGMAGHADLAMINGCPEERLRKRLEHWRNTHPEQVGKGWIKPEDRGPRDPGYLYNPAAVQAVIDECLSSLRRTSGEKKTRRKRP